MVAIKDFELPKECSECPASDYFYDANEDGEWKCGFNDSVIDLHNHCRPENCPLIEISEFNNNTYQMYYSVTNDI